MDLSEIKTRVNQLSVRLDVAKEAKHRLSRRYKQAKREVRDTAKAQEICQLVASTIQQRAHEKVAKVVSRCLEAVFDEPYTFRILFERKRGRTEARVLFERGGEMVDPLTASGGGVVDIAAFALRLSCLILNKPPLRRVLVLDEPFRFVSQAYQDRVASMVKQLSQEMEVQIIMVTHNPKYRMGKIIQL